MTQITQSIADVINGRVERLILPAPEEEIMAGVSWGSATAMFTPAYWAAQMWHAQYSGTCKHYTWSDNLRHEIAACLLGGYGITYEVNRAAFEALLRRGLLDSPTPSLASIIKVLSAPFESGSRRVRYRFPQQKGRFLHAALLRLENATAPQTLDAFRVWLLGFSGIGMKTASWVARNFFPGAQVAVIDIQVFRAGIAMGIFPHTARLPRDYTALEALFLQLASALSVEPGRLDAVIWFQMRSFGAECLPPKRAAA